jgi:hypothetical protein
VVSAWSEWSACSQACGAGEQLRARTVVRPAANGGTACPALEEKRACNPTCPDVLTSCAATQTCVCGKPSALYSPMGDLETGKRAPSPDLAWFATSSGIFATATAQRVWALDQAKGFDWHPSAGGRFAQMEHFSPPRPAAVVTVYQLSSDGRDVQPVAQATGDRFHHYLAWTPDGARLALGEEAACTTATTVTPAPL